MPGCWDWGLTLLLIQILCQCFSLHSCPTTQLLKHLVTVFCKEEGLYYIDFPSCWLGHPLPLVTSSVTVPASICVSTITMCSPSAVTSSPVLFVVVGLCLFILRFYLFIFRQRGREGKRGTETSMYGCLSCASPLGTWPVTQACALTGN